MKDFGLKEFLKPLLNSMRSFNEYNVKKSLELLFSDSVNIKMCYPFGILNDLESFFHTAYRPLLSALPDLERRDMILIAGTTPEGNKWVGSMGNYMGIFVQPFLKIPPNGHLVHMRYHEFFCIEENKIVLDQLFNSGSIPSYPNHITNLSFNNPISNDLFQYYKTGTSPTSTSTSNILNNVNNHINHIDFLNSNGAPINENYASNINSLPSASSLPVSAPVSAPAPVAKPAKPEDVSLNEGEVNKSLFKNRMAWVPTKAIPVIRKKTINNEEKLEEVNIRPKMAWNNTKVIPPQEDNINIENEKIKKNVIVRRKLKNTMAW